MNRLWTDEELMESAIRRFNERYVIVPSGCWEWTGSLNAAGYARLAAFRKNIEVHRFSYELHVGPIPEGLCIDHLCRNPKCVNPAHLEPVTNEENIRRGWKYRARAEVCKHGPPLIGDNVRHYVRAEGGQGRQCKTCVWLRDQRRKARLAAERKAAGLSNHSIARLKSWEKRPRSTPPIPSAVNEL